MSDLPMLDAAAPTGAWKMIRAMVGVGLLCGLAIVTAFRLTAPSIARNKERALQRAIFQVLPEARSSTTFRLGDDERFAVLDGEAAGDGLVYAGYDDRQRLVGLAVEAHGMGYQDVIRLIYGYSFDVDAIVGIRVLESKETPGLGERIETDAEFLQNFVRLDVSLDASLAAPVHPIETVKYGKKQHPWQVDGITGATISSVAIGRILRDSSAYWVPRIRRHLEDFQQGEHR